MPVSKLSYDVLFVWWHSLSHFPWCLIRPKPTHTHTGPNTPWCLSLNTVCLAEMIHLHTLTPAASAQLLLCPFFLSPPSFPPSLLPSISQSWVVTVFLSTCSMSLSPLWCDSWNSPSLLRLVLQVWVSLRQIWVFRFRNRLLIQTDAHLLRAPTASGHTDNTELQQQEQCGK